MHMRSTVVCVSVIFVTVSILSAAENHARAGLVISDSVGSTYDEWLEKAEKGKTGKFAGVHYYLKDGLHMDSRNKELGLKLGGKFAVDTGNITADDRIILEPTARVDGNITAPRILIEDGATFGTRVFHPGSYDFKRFLGGMLCSFLAANNGKHPIT